MESLNQSLKFQEDCILREIYPYTFIQAFFDLVKDIWEFMKVRKNNWLPPLIITIVLVGAILTFSKGLEAAAFIYSIF